MLPNWRVCWAALAVVVASAGCSMSASGLPSSAGSIAASAASGQSGSPPASLATPTGAATSAGSGDSPSQSQSPPPGPLAGDVVGIDPGHNGGNGADPVFIDSMIFNGRESETCDTTGTGTSSGYTEAEFNFRVASYLRADLIADGARVVMTRSSNDGVGPCVTTRAKIINRAHADVAIDIHADGGPVNGRGFTVLEPVADGPNDKVISRSVQFGADVKAAVLAATGMPPSDYYGANGFILRDDLAGLNLTTVPKILIECGNMRNATDAALLTQPRFQRRLAAALAQAIVSFLRPS